MKALVKIGSDPEVFITKDGKIVPSVGLVGGRKKFPRKIKGSKVGLGVLEDNVTVELNPRAYAFSSRLDCNQLAYNMGKELADLLAGAGLGYTLGHTHLFNAVELASPQAQEMGCDPDFLAHDDGAFRAALSPKLLGNYRFAAGHIHIGYDSSIIPACPMIQLIEALAYLPLLHKDQQGYGQNGRRSYYGIAGLFRTTSYGVEWRTPSNFWMKDGKLLEEVGKVATALVRQPTVAASVYKEIERSLATAGMHGWKVVASFINHEQVDNAPDVSTWRKRLKV